MEIYIGKDGQQLGPYSKNSLLDAYAKGDIALTDLAWSEGLAGWIVLSDYVKQTGLQLSPVKPAEGSNDKPSGQPASREGSTADFRLVAEKAADLAAVAGAAALAAAIQAKKVATPLIEKVKDSLKAAVAANPTQKEGTSRADTQAPRSAPHETKAPVTAQKSLALAYLLLFALGSGGAHRFYLGKKSSAFSILGLAVGGLLLSVAGAGSDSAVLAALGAGMLIGMLVWCLVDVFRLPKMARDASAN